MSHIFISYGRDDIEFARYLRLLLQKAGFLVWIDERGIEPSDDWWETIEKNILSCAALVVVMSPRSQDSRWVKRELLLAEDQQKPLFPVLLEGKVWSRLADIQAIDMSAGLRAPLPDTFVTRLRLVLPNDTASGIEFTITSGDARTFSSDVLVMKYATTFHGADEVVAQKLIENQPTPDEQNDLTLRLSPVPGEHSLIDSNGILGSKQTLYIGTEGLGKLRNYLAIRDLGASALRILAKEAPETRHIAMTVHGPGFGLDEVESLRYQLLGYTNAIIEGQFPPALQRITIIERNVKRVERLREAMEEDFRGRRQLPAEWGYIIGRPVLPSFRDRPKAKSKSITPDAKPHAFVIMSDNADSDDLFYYGIQGAVHGAGLLCERMEKPELNADTLAQIKDRIETASVVIADMSEQTAAIYLQIGYAWGKDRPTILLAKDGTPLKFASEDQACVFYKRIKDLENGLSEQLKAVAR